MTQLENVLQHSGDHMTDMDKLMAAAVVKSLAVSLFAAQSAGLIRFPAGQLLIGELESKVDFVAAVFVQKLIESKPS